MYVSGYYQFKLLLVSFLVKNAFTWFTCKQNEFLTFVFRYFFLTIMAHRIDRLFIYPLVTSWYTLFICKDWCSVLREMNGFYIYIVFVAGLSLVFSYGMPIMCLFNMVIISTLYKSALSHLYYLVMIVFAFIMYKH